MIYLCEREIGFDAGEIGFPSIDGCRAIVMVTAGGLFGYHLNGKLSTVKKNAFVNFITQHAQGNSRRALYAASAGQALATRYDQEELRDIARTLLFTGPIYWGTLPPGSSCYVHFQDINHNTCTITWRAWSDPLDNLPANKAAYVAGADRAVANGTANAQMYINAGTAGLRAVYPSKL
jgi:hypothetical protein